MFGQMNFCTTLCFAMYNCIYVFYIFQTKHLHSQDKFICRLVYIQKLVMSIWSEFAKSKIVHNLTHFYVLFFEPKGLYIWLQMKGGELNVIRWPTHFISSKNRKLIFVVLYFNSFEMGLPILPFLIKFVVLEIDFSGKILNMIQFWVFFYTFNSISMKIIYLYINYIVFKWVFLSSFVSEIWQMSTNWLV